MEILFLKQDEVFGLLTMADAMKAVEDAFREKGLGHVQMPPKSYIYYRKHDGDLRVMHSFLERIGISGVKVVNVHPNNPKSRGLPSVMAVIILIDPITGTPLVVMDGTYITALRTGAAGGIATKYLARRDSNIIGLVGAGRQAESQLEAISEVISISDVKVCDCHEEIARGFIKRVKERFDFNFKTTNSIEVCVKGSDIVSTITPSKEPLVKDEWVGKGTHINAIGADAPGKQELDPKILKRAKVVVDDYDQAYHSGEINVPLSQNLIDKTCIYGELGEIVCGMRKGRETDEERTVFDSTGLSIQDVTTAWLAYEKAKDKGIGKWLTLFS